MTDKDKELIEKTMVYLRNHSNPNLDIGYTHSEILKCLEFAIEKGRQAEREEIIKMIKEFQINKMLWNSNIDDWYVNAEDWEELKQEIRKNDN